MHLYRRLQPSGGARRLKLSIQLRNRLNDFFNLHFEVNNFKSLV